jgi:hypothetical protein
MMRFLGTIIHNGGRMRLQSSLKNDVLDIRIPNVSILSGMRIIIKNEDAIIYHVTDIVSPSDYYLVDVTQWKSGVYELSLCSGLVLMYDTLFFIHRTNIVRIFA